MRARPRSELPAGRSSLHVGGGGEAAAGSRGNAAPDGTLRTRARACAWPLHVLAEEHAQQN